MSVSQEFSWEWLKEITNISFKWAQNNTAFREDGDDVGETQQDQLLLWNARVAGFLFADYVLLYVTGIKPRLSNTWRTLEGRAWAQLRPWHWHAV